MSPLQTRPRVALDRRRIVDAALQIVDREGLDALSMRKLGGLLGVEAMALYHYFPSKAVLVDAVVALVLEHLEVPTADPGQPWPHVVRQLAVSFRALGRAHPNVFPLLATVGFENPASVAPAEAVLAVLTWAGLCPRDAFDAFIALKSYVVGHAMWEIGNAAMRQSGQAACVDPSQVGLGTEQPVLASLAGWLAQRAVDDQFEAGLTLLIEGIRARLGGAASRVGSADQV